MAIFAIGDLHLSLGTDKPMDVFPGWEGYLPKLEANWRRLIAPDDTIPIPCDTFNGNLVLVPRFAFRTLGTMDPRYSHSFGDYDYGIRADKAGVTTVIAPGVLAVCDRNPGLPKWRNRAFTLKQRYAAIMSPKGRPFKEQFLYDTRKGNVFSATVHFISLNIKVLFPKGRSAAAGQTTGMK